MKKTKLRTEWKYGEPPLTDEEIIAIGKSRPAVKKADIKQCGQRFGVDRFGKEQPADFFTDLNQAAMGEKEAIRSCAALQISREENDRDEIGWGNFIEKVNRRCGTLKTKRNAQEKKDLFLNIFKQEWKKDHTKLNKDAIIGHSITRLKKEHDLEITERTAWNYLRPPKKKLRPPRPQ